LKLLFKTIVINDFKFRDHFQISLVLLIKLTPIYNFKD